MLRPTLCLSLLLCASCADLRETADATTTIRLDDELSPVEIERTVVLGVDSLPLCLDVSLMLPGQTTTVALKRTSDTCAFTVTQPDLLILNQQEVENARRQSGNFDIDAIRRGSVSLLQLELWTDQGAVLDLSRYVDAVSVQIDNDVVLDRVTPEALMSAEPVSRPLPANLLNKLKTAVKSNQEAKAKVSLILILAGETLSDLPAGLKLRVVLQPQLEVNVIDAAF